MPVRCAAKPVLAALQDGSLLLWAISTEWRDQLPTSGPVRGQPSATLRRALRPCRTAARGGTVPPRGTARQLARGAAARRRAVSAAAKPGPIALLSHEKRPAHGRGRGRTQARPWQPVSGAASPAGLTGGRAEHAASQSRPPRADRVAIGGGRPVSRPASQLSPAGPLGHWSRSSAEFADPGFPVTGSQHP